MEIIAAGLFVELQTGGLLTPAGEPRKLVDTYRQLKQAQLAYERDLGMTPASRAAVGRDMASAGADLATALSKLDAEEDARP